MVENKVAELPVEVERPSNTLGVGRLVVKENHGRLERKHHCRRGQRASSTSSTEGVLIGASSMSNFSTASPNAVKKLKEKEIEIPNINYVDLTADSPHKDEKILTLSADTTPPELSFLRRHHRTSHNHPKAAIVPDRSYLHLLAETDILDLDLESGQTTDPMRGCTRIRTPVETRDEVAAWTNNRADERVYPLQTTEPMRGCTPFRTPAETRDEPMRQTTAEPMRGCTRFRTPAETRDEPVRGCTSFKTPPESRDEVSAWTNNRVDERVYALQKPMRGCTRFRTPAETRDEVAAFNKERADGQREEPNRLENVGTSSGGCFRRTYACKEKKDKEPAPLGTSNQLNGCSSGPEQVLVWKRKGSSLTDAGTSRQRFKPPRRVRDCSTSGFSSGVMERSIDVDSLQCPSSIAAAEGNVSASPIRAQQIEEDELLAKFLQEDYGLEADAGNFALDDAHFARMLQEEENAKYMQQTVESASQVDHGSVMRAARREMQRVLPTIRPPATRPTTSSSRMRILRNLHDRSRQQMGRGRRLGGLTTNSNDRLLHFPEGLDLETRVEFLAALETVSQGSVRMLDQMDRDFNEGDYEMLLALDDNNHSHSGASYNKIEQLPISVIKPTDVYQELCSICLDLPVVNDVVRRLPCMHGFHLKCIDEWLGRQANCPICKMEI